MSWAAFEASDPEMAAFGRERFTRNEVAYLATTRKDGSPRVHAIHPTLAAGRLLVFMYPTSPKGHDIERDGRYAMHCSVEDNSGGGGEFYIRGRAWRVDSDELWEAVRPGKVEESRQKYVLFEFSVDEARATRYVGDETLYSKWRRDDSRNDSGA